MKSLRLRAAPESSMRTKSTIKCCTRRDAHVIASWRDILLNRKAYKNYRAAGFRYGGESGSGTNICTRYSGMTMLVPCAVRKRSLSIRHRLRVVDIRNQGMDAHRGLCAAGSLAIAAIFRRYLLQAKAASIYSPAGTRSIDRDKSSLRWSLLEEKVLWCRAAASTGHPPITFAWFFCPTAMT